MGLVYQSTFTRQHITLNITAGLNDSQSWQSYQNWTNVDSYKNDLRSNWNLERRKIMRTLINNYMRSVGIETTQTRVHSVLTCIGCQHLINGVRINCNHMVSWSILRKQSSVWWSSSLDQFYSILLLLRLLVWLLPVGRFDHRKDHHGIACNPNNCQKVGHCV